MTDQQKSIQAVQRIGWSLTLGSFLGLLGWATLPEHIGEVMWTTSRSLLPVGLWALWLGYIWSKHVPAPRQKVRLAVVPNCQGCGWSKAKNTYRGEVWACGHPELEEPSLDTPSKAPPHWCPLYQDV